MNEPHANDSLRDAVARVIDRVFADANARKAPLAHYEIEVRMGTTNSKTPSGTSEQPEYVQSIPGSRWFQTGIDGRAFYTSAQMLLDWMRPLCHTILDFETSFVSVDAGSGTRFVLNDNGTLIAENKTSLCDRIDYVGVLSNGQTEMPLALRLAASIETPLVIDDALRFRYKTLAQSQGRRRKRERRSFYLHDTSTVGDGIRWASAKEIMALGVAAVEQMPRNVWRIDFTCVDDGAAYQIELELDLQYATQLINAEYGRSWPRNAQDERQNGKSKEMVYFKYRVISMLGECLFRVQQAIDANTRPTWCRAL